MAIGGSLNGVNGVNGAHGAHGVQPLECIDMASPEKLANAARIRTLTLACVSSGFFYIINHGLGPKFLAQVFAQSKKFFALPEEEKMKVFRGKSEKGYMPFGEEILNPAYQSKGGTEESFQIGFSNPEIDMPLYGPNKYPSPDLLPGWRETMDRYYQEMTNLANKLASLMALVLNLEESFFEQLGFRDNPTSTVRLFHYSAEKSNIEDGLYAAGAHTDWGFFTLHATDDVPGLQMCGDKDAVPQVWEDVLPMNGAYIVNLGQMLERWSNGLFRYHISFTPHMTA